MQGTHPLFSFFWHGWDTRRTAIRTLHLTCGLPCSGKTTLARQIERETDAVRLTGDEWLYRLLDSDPEEHPDGPMRERLEALLFELALKLLSKGLDVVLDFGVWSRSEREDFRARAAAAGARTELHVLNVPLDELLRRLEGRNANLPPGTYIITPEQIRLWWTWFEPPAADELLPREPH